MKRFYTTIEQSKRLLAAGIDPGRPPGDQNGPVPDRPGDHDQGQKGFRSAGQNCVSRINSIKKPVPMEPVPMEPIPQPMTTTKAMCSLSLTRRRAAGRS